MPKCIHYLTAHILIMKLLTYFLLVLQTDRQDGTVFLSLWALSPFYFRPPSMFFAAQTKDERASREAHRNFTVYLGEIQNCFLSGWRSAIQNILTCTHKHKLHYQRSLCYVIDWTSVFPRINSWKFHANNHRGFKFYASLSGKYTSTAALSSTPIV